MIARSARSSAPPLAALIALAIACLGAPACGAPRAAGPAILPLPTAFYSPETGFGLGGMAMISWPPSFRGDGVSRSDSLRFGGCYTQNSQALAWASAEFFSRDGASKLGVDGSLSRFPSRFYGLGPAAAIDEQYVPLQASAEASLAFLVAPDLFVGPKARLAASKTLESPSGGALAGGTVGGSAGYLATGAGLKLFFDRRDSSMAPTSGLYLDLGATFFPSIIAASSAYGLASIDARAYLRPFPALPATVATQAWVSAAFGADGSGSVPFQELPKLGGDRLHRGFLEGRYRDAWAAALQAELRVSVWRRFGLTLFGSLAQVAGRPTAFSLAGFTAAGGVGLRFRMDDASGANLRVDAAWGDGGPRFYFNFGEAF